MDWYIAVVSKSYSTARKLLNLGSPMCEFLLQLADDLETS